MSSLVADYGSTSESDGDESEDDEHHEDGHRDRSLDGGDVEDPKLVNPFRGRRPLPPRAPLEAKHPAAPHPPTPQGSSVASSVFANPFRAAEDAKKALLEKHVKLSPTPQEVTTINGRQICWNYRKGRCHFGHRCKFAHDSDLPRGQAAPNSGQVGEDVNPGWEQQAETMADYGHSSTGHGHSSTGHGHSSTGHGHSSTGRQSPEDPEGQPPKRGKKRPGLSRSLVPGKKVMKDYKRQQVKEMPWVVASKATT